MRIPSFSEGCQRMGKESLRMELILNLRTQGPIMCNVRKDEYNFKVPSMKFLKVFFKILLKRTGFV